MTMHSLGNIRFEYSFFGTMSVYCIGVGLPAAAMGYHGPSGYERFQEYNFSSNTKPHVVPRNLQHDTREQNAKKQTVPHYNNIALRRHRKYGEDTHAIEPKCGSYIE